MIIHSSSNFSFVFGNFAFVAIISNGDFVPLGSRGDIEAIAHTNRVIATNGVIMEIMSQYTKYWLMIDG